MKGKRALKLLAPFMVLLAVLLVSGSAMAFQDPYPIYGTVTDADGNAVANATITVVNLETEEELEDTTDANGNYVIELINMPSGYSEDDDIRVTAENATLSGTGSTSIDSSKDTPGSRVDIVLGEAAGDGLASFLGAWWWLILIIVAILIAIVVFLVWRSRDDENE